MDLFRGINDNDSNNSDDGQRAAAATASGSRPEFRSMAMPLPGRERFVGVPSHHHEAATIKTTTQDDSQKMMMMHVSELNNGKTHQEESFPSSSPSSSPATWPSLDKLTSLSYFHPLENTHCKFAYEVLPQVLTRLSHVLRQLSCRVEYETDRVVAFVQGMEGVEFQLAVWQEAKTSRCVLELQRVSGDCMCFHRKYAAALLKVPREMEQEPVEQEPAKEDEIMDTLPESSSMSNRHDGMLLDKLVAHCAPCPDDEITESLEFACDLLMSDRLDACRLGLESMQGLVDPRTSGWQTALQVARGMVQHRVAAPTLWRHCCGVAAQPLDSSLVALQIYTNAWQVLAEAAQKHGDDEAASCAVTNLPPGAVPALLTHVSRVQTCPHHAALGCAALHALVQLDANIGRQISWHTISHAHTVGCAQHVALQFASQQLLQSAASVQS